MDNYIRHVRNMLSKNLGEEIDVDLLDLYTLLVLTKGVNTTLEHVHDAWAIWRNNTAPGHKSLIQFGELSSEVQRLDGPYQQAIIKTAGELEYA